MFLPKNKMFASLFLFIVLCCIHAHLSKISTYGDVTVRVSHCVATSPAMVVLCLQLLEHKMWKENGS